MATAPLAESDIEDTDADKDSARLGEVHERAMARFDATAMPQVAQRAEMLADRRFTTITGAMWEDGFQQVDDLLPRPEIDRITKNQEKIEEDARENRIEVTFLPAEGADEDTANTLADAFRADAHVAKAGLAWDNAFSEALKGGMGAWRLTSDYADPYDPDNDHQRINPGVLIPDADQSVYFYGGIKPDGSDAEAAWIISNLLRADFDEKWGADNADGWPVQNWRWQWDWYQPDVVQVAEYYEIEDKEDRVLIFTQEQSGEEQRYFKSEMEDGVSANLKAQGWKRTERPWKRKRVHKYIMNGSRVVKDCGYIAGDNIPIVVLYGRVDWVDNLMRVRGYTRKKKDAQRLLNSGVSRIMEIDSIAPFEVPIVADEQLDNTLMQEWAEGNIKRYPFRRLKPLRNEGSGEIVSAGPVGKIEAPQAPPTTAAILQISTQFLSDDDEDADVPANTSAEAIELVQNRVDSRSVIYLDNRAQAHARGGEIWRGMARDLYYEQGREIETRNIDGQPGKATLGELTLTNNNVYRIRNDLTKGTYHVEAAVQEATATKRQKAFRMGMELSTAFMNAQSPGDAVAMLYDAVDNLDGLDPDAKDFFRQKALAAGVKKPTPEEAQQIQQAAAQKQQQPDPQAIALQAAVQESQGKAAQAQATAQQKAADARLKDAQAEALEKAPAVPTGLSTPPSPADALDQAAGARLKLAQANKLDNDVAHQRIRTGAQIIQEAHDRDITQRQQALQERQQDHAETQSGGTAQ